MSYVYDVILVHDCSGDPGPDEFLLSAAMKAIQRWLRDKTGDTLKDVHRFGDGGYSMSRRIWIGAFNYLPVDDFVLVVRGAPWRDIDAVQLFVGCQEYLMPLEEKELR